MAKERADKPRKEKAEKAEKKVSQDKVKKHKKDKKPKVENDAETSSVDINLGEDYVALAEASAESPATASKPQYKDKKEKRRKEKKQKKVEKELQKKSKKGAIKAAIEEGASSVNATKPVDLPVRPASKGSDSKADSSKADSDADSDAESNADSGAPLFTIDVNPSIVVPQVREDEDDRRQGEQPKIAPPSGLNRQERRRIRLIEEQREKIQKKLGVVPGGPDKADEVQAALDKWVVDFDGKRAMRDEKRKVRKAKEAARIRNKRGKALTGRKLVERKKEIQKQERANKRQQGLSAPVAA